MKVKVTLWDRTNTEVTTFEFEHDSPENYIQLVSRTGSTICVLDPLTDTINMYLPTVSTVDLPEVIPPEVEP